MVPVVSYSDKRGIGLLLSRGHRADLQTLKIYPDNRGLSFDHGCGVVHGATGLRHQIVLPLVFYHSFDWPPYCRGHFLERKSSF